MTHLFVTWLDHMRRDSFAWSSLFALYGRHLRISFICDMTHLFVTWRCKMWYDMTHSYVTWLILIHTFQDSFVCGRLICSWLDSSICDMTHLFVIWLIYLWHDSIMYDMTCSYGDMTRLYVTWLVHTKQSFPPCMVVSCRLHLFMTWLIRMWHDSFICDMTRLCVALLVHTKQSFLLFTAVSCGSH